MTGVITAIKRLSASDGDGLRSVAFFKGCGLKCVWCHNPETQSFAKQIEFHAHKCVSCGECVAVCSSGALTIKDGVISFDRQKCSVCGRCAEACPTEARTVVGQEWTADALAEKLMEDKPFFDNGGGVTLSGGECLLQADFAVEVARILTQNGVSVDIDTCGLVSRSALDKILPYTDVFLYDLKAIDGGLHQELTGGSNAVILDNLKYLSDSGAKIEIRIPLVPQYNQDQIGEMGRFLSGLSIIKVKVLAYHDHARSKYESLGMADTMPKVKLPTVKDVDGAVERLKSYGLNAINGMLND